MKLIIVLIFILVVIALLKFYVVKLSPEKETQEAIPQTPQEEFTDTRTEDEIREKANEVLSNLNGLSQLATNQKQRSEIKDARMYLESASETGSKNTLRVGLYHYGFAQMYIQEVENAKLKAAKKAYRKTKNESKNA